LIFSVWAHYVRDYGYPVIVLWCFVGAEEGVLAGGLAASHGLLNPLGVVLASALGGALGDQVYFYLARAYGRRLLDRSSKLRRFYPRAEGLVRKYGWAVAGLSRFLVGLRITVATACGIFRMPPIKYSMLNLAGALVWASIFTAAGYSWGRALETTTHHPGRPYWIAAEVVLGGLALILALRFQRRRTLAASEAVPGPEASAAE
jgi:membrane protein DedA with SNARE-associated domain